MIDLLIFLPHLQLITFKVGIDKDLNLIGLNG